MNGGVMAYAPGPVEENPWRPNPPQPNIPNVQTGPILVACAKCNRLIYSGAECHFCLRVQVDRLLTLLATPSKSGQWMVRRDSGEYLMIGRDGIEWVRAQALALVFARRDQALREAEGWPAKVVRLKKKTAP
jgi:hypothetical protein